MAWRAAALLAAAPALSAAAAAAAAGPAPAAPAPSFRIQDVRPPPGNRTFSSALVDYVVDAVGRDILPQPLGTLFANCLPNTLDTTVLRAGEVEGFMGKFWDSFIITGDIPAMWLRDSMNQVYPYIALVNASVAAGKQDPQLENFLFGAVHRQAASVLVDAYANAFAWLGPGGQSGSHSTDLTYKEFEPGAGPVNAMQDPRIFERKFELDSLLSVLKLASALYEVLPSEATARFLEDPMFVPAVAKVLDTLEEMTFCASNAYTFQRTTAEPTDSLLHGVGFPCRDTGMVRTHFRPSDDSVVYAFNIPGNAMAVVELRRLTVLLVGLQAGAQPAPERFPWAAGLAGLLSRATNLAASVAAGIRTYGTMVFHGETVFAYEVDGFGNAIFMDDANVPSLLSLPLLGFLKASDPLYQATRRMLLSANNPWYSEGKLGIAGIGGPHEGTDMIWPMSLMVQAWTSTDVQEVATLLDQLMRTAEPNSLMHESFNKDTLSIFTRSWFAWANTLFGNLLLRVAADPVLFRAANLTQPLDLVGLLRKWVPAADDSVRRQRGVLLS